jgi:hypothetical protein
MVHLAVVDGERVSHRLVSGCELVDRPDHELLELVDPDSSRRAHVRLLPHLLDLDLVHLLLLQEAADIGEDLSPFRELARKRPLVLVDSRGARIVEHLVDLDERHAGAPKQPDQRGGLELVEPIRAMARFGIDVGGR